MSLFLTCEPDLTEIPYSGSCPVPDPLTAAGIGLFPYDWSPPAVLLHADDQR